MSNELTREQVLAIRERLVRTVDDSELKGLVNDLAVNDDALRASRDAYKNAMVEEMAENVKLFELLGVHEEIKAGTAGTEAVIKAIKALIVSREEERERAKQLGQAVGLASTCAPSMEMDAEHPVKMMQQVCEEFENLKLQVADLTKKLTASEAKWHRAATHDSSIDEAEHIHELEQQLIEAQATIARLTDRHKVVLMAACKACGSEGPIETDLDGTEECNARDVDGAPCGGRLRQYYTHDEENDQLQAKIDILAEQANENGSYIQTLLQECHDYKTAIARLQAIKTPDDAFTYCAYCGFKSPVDENGEEIAAHIRTCEKHPMRAMELDYDQRITTLRNTTTVQQERIARLTWALCYLAELGGGNSDGNYYAKAALKREHAIRQALATKETT